MGSTVGDVLESQDIEVGEHDKVAPGLDEKVDDGSAISVRYGRPLELEVDGSARTYWVTSTDVESALAEIGRRFSGADLSASRSADIDRGGMSLTVVTPKTLTVKVGNGKTVKKEVAGLTVRHVLRKLDVDVDKNDLVKPSLKSDGRRGRQDHRHQGARREEEGRRREHRLRHRRARGLLDVRRRHDHRPLRRRRCAGRDLQARLPQRQALHDQGPLRQGPPQARGRHRQGRHQGAARPRTSPAAAASGTRSRSASPAATGPSTPATATTAASSSTWAPGSRTAAPACPATPAARPRSRSRPRSATPRAATAPGRTAPPASACPPDAPPHRATASRPTRLTPMPEPADTTSAGPRLLGPADVRSLAAALDLRPTKQRGQNFVIDANTVRRIVRESGVSGDDVVIEVGPGLGSLTLALLAVARRVVAVEVDPVLAEALPATIATYAPAEAARCEVVLADAMRVTEIPGPPPTALVANLPYNVSVPVLLHLLAPAALARARAGDGAGRGRRPAGRPARLQGLRRPVGEGRVVRRRAPGRRDRPQRLLAGAQRGLRAWSPGPAATLRSPPPPARRSSRSSTRRSRTGARRCAPPSRRWPAPLPPPRPRSPTPASTRWPAARCSAWRAVRPGRRGAAPR